MNRSILIVICDFLLLSLLTFSTDINKMADENTQPPTKVVVATNTVVNAGADLVAVMKRALEDERKGRDQLQQQLEQVRSSTTQQQTQLQQQLAQFRNATVQQQAQLSEREQENLRLQQQFAATQTNVENLNRQLHSASASAQESLQKLAASQTAAQRESELSAALRQQLDLLTKSNELAAAEKQRLAGELRLAEVEKQAAADRAALMQQEVQATHAENEKLAEGFKTLATNSTQLTQEIRENRALAPNTIFSDFISNRVSASIFGERSGWFGADLSKDKRIETVLATDGTNYFALCHVQDTPVTLWDPGTDWDKFTGTLAWQSAQVPIRSLSFQSQDPRVVMIPVTAAEARQLGAKIYHLSADPYKFQDAVLVGVNEGYYGECNFKIDLDLPQYVRLDRSLLKGLFGKFNPSRGDLVFSRTGELLGIMVNNTYCLVIHRFAPVATIPFDQNLRQQHTSGTLALLFGYVFDLPQRLQ